MDLDTFYMAVQFGDVPTVKRGLEAGVDVNAKRDWGGLPDQTSLHVACEYGQTEVVELLIQHGSDVAARAWHQSTPLHLAAYEDHTKTCEVLIRAKADVNAKNETQWTPLHRAAYCNHTRTCKVLIDAGAEVNARNQDQHTPLDRAAGWGHTETCELLIREGAELMAPNVATPLHWAAKYNQTRTCELLIEKGADVTAKDKSGRTPIDIANGQDTRRFLKVRAEVERKEKQEKFYHELLQQSGGVRVDRFKVFLGGNGTNGKSTLKKSLIRKDPLTQAQSVSSSEKEPHDPTPGVDIGTFHVPGVGEVSVWDFAGQAEYAVTHSMFMDAENTVFIVLYNITDKEETNSCLFILITTNVILLQVHWWLCFIKSCNPNRQPDVILVASHRDKVASARGQRLAARLLESVKEEFQDHLRIADEVILMDCRQTRTPEMDQLKRRLVRIKQALLQNQRDMPRLCAEIMKCLPEWGQRKTGPKCPVMMWPDYVKEVRGINKHVTEDFLQKSTRYLHHLAEVLFITPTTSDPVLILKPNWLGTNVFGPIMAPDKFPIPRILRKRRDYITRSEIQEVFQDVADVDLLITLLLEFQLCHTYNGLEFIFPGLLTQTMPSDKWQPTQEPKVVYFGKQLQCADSTDMFSSGFFPRVQTRLMRELENHPLLWRDGAKCADRDVEGLIKLSPDGRAVNICVRSAQGDKVQCGKMLQQLENIIADVLYECSPGTNTVENVLSARALKEHREEFYSYGKKEISEATAEGGTIHHPTLGFTEQVSNLLCMETPLTRNRPELVQILQDVEPILKHLQARDILTEEDCSVIRDHSMPHERACALLDKMKTKNDDARWVFTTFRTVFPNLCMHCLECKPCPIPLACGCAFLLCAACMKSQTKGFHCPKHHVITTGLGYNTFVIAVGQDGHGEEDFREDAIGFTEIITDPNICGVRKDNVKLLLDAEIADVEAAVTEVAAKIQQVPEGQESFFIYYHSGHGDEQCLGFWSEHILQAVSSGDLEEIFRGSGATKSLFILDACHSSSNQVYTMKGAPQESSSINGEEVDEGNPQDPEPPLAKFDKDVLPEGSMLWASSRITQKSWKWEEQYSVFTKYIISGLQGGNCGRDSCSYCLTFQRRARDAGAVSLDILNDYVYDHVKNKLRQTPSLQGQTPSLLGQHEKTYWMAYTQDQARAKAEDAQQTFQVQDREDQTSSSAGAGPDR
ncbi:death-associated protein kinase dapk-1-like [Branchiostoma floridae]|uniref:Death-associated protein kinase dapk-1-like n=2 Tax=Branchiostoma floridae TaxID=7739 RepID=A0A9J7MSA1_BRAFL|nr:death-associated protein kinase dapk-1-like [Branchiostoma floridae]